MKHLLTAIAVFGIMALSGAAAQAAPFKAADKNPGVVAYYTSGPHGIVGESGIYHEGTDLVMRAGQSGNFQQWFFGTSAEGVGLEGDHSVWKLSKNGTCANGWNLVKDANAAWGDYLLPGDYCVHTNDFNSRNGSKI